MKKGLFSLALLAGMSFLNAQTVVFEDSFEEYEDFTIENFGGWVQDDLDGGQTWGVTELGEFENANYVGAGMIFNAVALDPSLDGSEYDARTGDKGLYFFASGANATAYPNDDWTVSPQISLEGLAGAKLELYAKALTNSYGPDQFEIGVSTEGTEWVDFTIVSSTFAPGTEYTKYEIDLSDYDGQEIYIAIHCTTDDGLLLMIDDFKVTAETTAGVSDLNKAKSAVYPNPVVDSFNVNLSAKMNANNVKVTVSDMTGKEVKSFGAASSYNVADLAAGVYVVKITDGQNTETKKIVKK
jgi:hypothetical protein